MFNEPVNGWFIFEDIDRYCDDDADTALLLMNYGCLFLDDHMITL